MRAVKFTCVHEASHAVISAELARCISVDIEHVPNDRLGLVLHRAAENPVHRIAIAVAGGLGEWLARGQRGPKYDDKCREDLKNADAELIRLRGKTPIDREHDRLFQLGEELALQILKQFWGTVLHLAARLESHKKFDGIIANCALIAAKVSD